MGEVRLKRHYYAYHRMYLNLNNKTAMEPQLGLAF